MTWSDDTGSVSPRDERGEALEAPPALGPGPTPGELLCREVFGDHSAPWERLSPTVRGHYEAAAARVVERERREHANALAALAQRIEYLEAELAGFRAGTRRRKRS
jgi:hypothetical protein